MRLKGNPGIVIPVTGAMGLQLIPRFALERVSKEVIGAFQDAVRENPVAHIQIDSIVRFILEREWKCDVHFLIDSDGGSTVLLNQYRAWIDLVSQKGGTSRSYVPSKASSAAALLAISTKECITMDQASFLFHAVVEADDEEVLKRSIRNDLARALGQPVAGPDEEPNFVVTPQTLATHRASVTDLLRNARDGSSIKTRVEDKMVEAGNERGEFTITGADMASLKRAKSVKGSSGFRSTVFSTVGYLPGEKNRYCEAFWSGIKS